MFNNKQLEIIKKVGAEGLDLSVAAAELDMLYVKFLEEYNDSEEAQLAFEKGRAMLKIKVVTLANAQMEKGDPKALEFVSEKILNMSGKVKVDTGVTSSKKNNVVNPLLNPDLLLAMDDGELS